jgi:hypothetical protein
MAGGEIDATTLDDECLGGFIAARPSFSLRYTAGDLPLFIGASSDEDTTIVVRTPNGEWRCDDDSAGALNPAVSWDSPRSGRYQIWVGRFGAQNAMSPAMLHVSEEGASWGAPVGETPDWALDPAYGAVELAAGFEPDPHTMAISAGGELDAMVIPGCVGWVARAPDYRVNWTAGSGELPLIFSVAAAADTTLVINDAEGNWVCDDDGGAEGLNPAISFANAVSGQYDIWVGTFTQEGLQPSVLHVSELTSQ